MLDDLGLGEMSRRLDELVRSPQGMDLNPLQLMREVVSSQHLLHCNERFERNLRISKMVRQDASVENLRSGEKRIYNENVVDQLRTLEFISDRKNVTVVGESDAGKTYFLRAFCVEACRSDYRTLFIDYRSMNSAPSRSKSLVTNVSTSPVLRTTFNTLTGVPLMVITSSHPAGNAVGFHIKQI